MTLYLREEFFGSIVYHPLKAQYFNLDHEQTQQLTNYIEQKSTILNEALLTSINPNIFDPLFRIKNKCARQGILSAPLKAFFNITKKCNLFCRHCYNDSGREDSPELPYAEVAKVLSELQARGIFKVTIAGGEPLFHPEFNQIIDYWDNTDLAISLITNGICISKRRAIRLNESKNLRSITVSLDGPTAKSNDQVRGEGAFSKAIRGLQLLKKHCHQSISVRITLMQSNIEQVEVLPVLLADLGIDEIKVNSINAYGRAKEATDLLITPEEYIAARQRLFEAAEGKGINLEVPAHKYQKDKNDQIGLCRSGEETFEIDGDGSVYPCSFSFGRFLAGNIRSMPFDEIFKKLQEHTINNAWCLQCKGRGGQAEKVFGNVPRLVQWISA